MKNRDGADEPSQSTGFRIISDPIYGFRRLDPVPTEGELSDFYESRYYDLVRKGTRAPDIQRLLEGGEPAAKERLWLRETLYSDIVNTLETAARGRDLLEVGCGIGDFVAFAQEHGFIAVGTEPAAEAAQEAAARGLTVHNLPLQRFAARFPSARFDVVVMINVLEHLPNAVQALHTCKQVLKPKGILCIHVPNDFSQMQVVATEKLGIDPWWIAFPDHINYFDFESLRQLLDRLEFETIHAQATFPMEMFLLMGENYVGNRDVGNGCHMRRVQFEMSVPPELRRKIYTALASVGVGRTCLVFGRRNAS